MLAAMFSGRHYIPTDAEGRYFIDRDGAYFGYVSPSATLLPRLSEGAAGLGCEALIASPTAGGGDNLLEG